MIKIALICKKIGMTSIFLDTGHNVPVTALLVENNFFLGKKTYKNKESVLIGSYSENKKVNKPQLKNLEKSSLPLCNIVKEFELSLDPSLSISLGHKFEISEDSIGSIVDSVSFSKGKGFQGGMKRWGFKGLPASHGVSVSHRSIGSTGNRTEPGKVFKGKKMPGHMGNEKIRVQNLKIVSVDKEKNIIFVKGSIPGHENSTVYITDAVKKSNSKVASSLNFYK